MDIESNMVFFPLQKLNLLKGSKSKTSEKLNGDSFKLTHAIFHIL